MLRKYLLSCILFIFISGPCYAKINATVDRTSVYLGESLQFTIHAGSENSEASPDITPLKKDFDILSSGQSSQIVVTNGKSFTDTLWVFVIAPKTSGNLTIPSIQVGPEATKPLSVTVQTNTSAASETQPIPDNRHVFMQAFIAPTEPYVQSQALYTLKIYYDKQIADPRLSEPKIDAVNFIHLGDDKNYKTELNNHAYQVMELHFAMFPQKSGSMKIESPVFSGNMMNQSAGQYFSNLWQPFRITANTLQVNVKPAPKNNTQAWWLPAKELKLSEKWSTDSKNISVGVPVTRTIIVKAQDVLAEQLPNLIPSSLPNFEIYPDKATTNTKTDGSHLYATRVEKAAFIATQPGTYTLPAINLQWLNTQTNQMETATLPAVNFTVSGDASSAKKIASAVPATSSIPMTTSLSKKIKTLQPKGPIWQDIWFWAANSLFLMLILLLIFLWFSKKKMKPPIIHHEANKQADRIASLRNLRADVKEAARNNDLLGFKSSLIALANATWPGEKFLSIGDIINKTNDAYIKEKLKEFENILYKQTVPNWQASDCWHHVQAVFIIKKEKNEEDELLPPLNK